MPPTPEASARLKSDGRAILRAVVYSLAIAALVIFASAEPHVFVYEGF
jgi:hypothetical protein